MKLVVVGFGQCGCNIADEFYAINNYAKSFFGRRIEILTDGFAVNTDEADLGSFRHIPKDKRHRILIGSIRAFGHGVGKINFDAARIIRESHSVVSDTILKSNKFHESDAVMTIASGGGGTGSGTIGQIIKELKERVQKPVYAVIILPFAFEEQGDTSYAVINTATCLNTVNRYADAVFLVDNERFRRTESSLANNLDEINKDIVGSFFDLCCAGEERNQKYVGSKVVDAGDIIQSLSGITTIGRGAINLSTFHHWKKQDFREGVKEHSSAVGALRQAENSLGLGANLQDSRKILALLSGPKDSLTLTILEEIANFLQGRAPKAVVRIGDYPRRKREISVSLIASHLTKAARMENMYIRAEELINKQQEISKEAEKEIQKMLGASKNIPTLD